MKRRQFLQAFPALSLPLFIKGFPVEAMTENPLLHLLGQQSLMNGRVLVLVQLNGGNDGLNTVLSLDRYAELTAARSNILIPQSAALTLNGTSATALHPAMTEMQQLYNNGQLNIVQGVSYPNPNFSHFRATDIWLTAAASNQYLTTGWLGRTLDQQFPGYPNGYPNTTMPDPLAIQIGSQASTMTQAGETNAAFTVTDPSSFYNFVNPPTTNTDTTPYGTELFFLRQKQQQTNQYAGVIKAANSAGNNLATYPANNALANQLKIVARLIKGGLKTPLYIVNHPNSFDTHTNQTDATNHIIGVHANALGLLSKAIGAFQQDLGLMGIQDRVTGMTFTEFGRRIKSNGSVGTDHGTSIPMFFFGAKLNPGLTGASPVLPANATVNDQIPMQFDFRQVYYTVLRDWFQLTDADLAAVLFQTYSTLPIFSQSILPVNIKSFTGAWKNARVSLQWITDKEVNVDRFEVERSTDGLGWTKIGAVAALNAASGATYDFGDVNLQQAFYYYRLRVVEKSGSVKYSSILLLKDAQVVKGVRMKILPNPIDNWFTTSFQDKVSGTITVRMLDLSGKEIWQGVQQANDVYNLTFTINKQVMPGVYVLQVRDGSGFEASSRVLLR
jgi:uncharacterized protein (DUF1501 family)